MPRFAQLHNTLLFTTPFCEAVWMRDAATGKAARGSILGYVIRRRAKGAMAGQAERTTSKARQTPHGKAKTKKMEAWTGIEPV